MKKVKLTLLSALTICFFACQNDDSLPGELTNGTGEQTAVEFVLDASDLGMGGISHETRTHTPTYNKNGFHIYAFQKNGADYVYEQTIEGTTLTYSDATKKLTGIANLEIGSYKFVATYGQTLTPSATTKLTDALLMTIHDAAQTELFLETDKANTAALTNYDFKVAGKENVANAKVSIVLKRAVSRVDLLFVWATKVNNVYTEQAYTGTDDVLKGKTIKEIDFAYTTIPSQMNVVGKAAATTVANKSYTIDYTAAANKVTLGTNATDVSSSVGGSTYTSFDKVEATHILKGGAHIFGTYMYPFASATSKAGLTLKVTATDGTMRTIPIGVNQIPLEQNKVTLVKVYVTTQTSTPPNIFSTDVEFEVEIKTAWSGSNHSTGEIN